MELILLALLGALCYSLGMLVYLPCKLYSMKRASLDVWTFLSRRRLLLTGFAYLISAPFPGFLCICISAAGVSGSHAVDVPDWLENANWIFLYVWLAASLVSFSLMAVRPRSAEHRPE